jgi:hypothetical protein
MIFLLFDQKKLILWITTKRGWKNEYGIKKKGWVGLGTLLK